MNATKTLKQSLRKKMREERQSFPLDIRQQKSLQMSHFLLSRPEFINAKTISLYWPFDNEIDPLPLLSEIYAKEKQAFMPILSDQKTLQFVELTSNTRFEKNVYGIEEPVVFEDTKFIEPKYIDLVLLPLVAFDKKGHRLGMGAGFYDRTFSFLQHETTLQQETTLKKPYLLGLGYEFQKLPDIPVERFDINLSAVQTEKQFYQF